MSQVVVGGRATAVPGVYGNTKHATASRRPAPLGKVLTVVGEFPFLENGKFARFSGPSAMTRGVPGNPIVEQIAALAFAPAADDRVRGAATEIVLASVLPSTQAFLQLVDRYSVETLRIKSRLWGALGNQTAIQLSDDTTDSLLRDLALGRNGKAETHSDLGSGPVVSVLYTAGPIVTKAYLAVRSPLYDAATGEATAEVDLIGKIPALTGDAVTTTLGANERSCDGKITVQLGDGVMGDTTFTFSGVNKATGLVDTDTVTIADGTAAPGTTTKEFSRLDSIANNLADAATFQVTFPIRRISKSVASYISDIVAILNDVPLVTATIKNAQASYMPIGALDFLPSTDVTTVGYMRADVWSAVETINARCVVAEAVRLVPTSGPTITRQGSSGVATFTNGSTAGSAFTSTVGLVAGDVLLFGNDSAEPFATLVVASVDGAATVTFESASPGAWTGGPVWLLRPSVPRRPRSFSGGEVAVTGSTHAAETLTVGVGHPLVNGDAVQIELGAGATLPTELDEGVTYYIGDATLTGATVKLYDAPGGSVVSFTADVTGTVTLVRQTQTRYMGGGADGVETTESRDACFAALRQSETAILVPLSTSAGLVQAALDHAVYMAGPGARECNVWAGAPANTALADLKALAVGYNSRHISLCGQEIRLVDPRGRRTWFGPQWQALQCAAMQAGMGIAQPITSKRPRCVDVRSPASWDGTTHANDLILAGITAYSRDNIGLKVTRAVTTHLASEDVAQTEVSANESVSWSIRDLRDYLTNVIGTDSAEVEINSIAGIAIARLRKQKSDKRITDFDETRVEVSRVNDVVRVGYPLYPAVPNNFVIIEPSVEAVVFELALS